MTSKRNLMIEYLSRQPDRTASLEEIWEAISPGEGIRQRSRFKLQVIQSMIANAQIRPVEGGYLLLSDRPLVKKQICLFGK
jgi:hypothetical protein